MTTIIPSTGMMTVQEYADIIGIKPSALMQALTDNKIHVVRLGKKYTQRIISLDAMTKHCIDAESGE